jgi:ubiquinone/menaquinone biosynthesis C-methylase UbiE
MESEELSKYWDGNAEAWTQLSRAGYDTYRNYLNTPAFFELLPEVDGLKGLDLGCGEGYNTRLLAEHGAKVIGLDISSVFVRHAKSFQGQSSHIAEYLIGNAQELPFVDACFDFVTGFMSFMDIPDTAMLLEDVWRALKPGGFLQFSISHPCFDLPLRKNLRDAESRTYAFEMGGYFERDEGNVAEWLFSAAPPEAVEGLRKFQTPNFNHLLSYWLNTLIQTGFILEAFSEPTPDDQTVLEQPNIQDAQVIAYFLITRACKPA